MPGSQRSLVASLPYFQMAYIASEPWTDTIERMPESQASSSTQARPYWTEDIPGRP